MEPPRGPVWLKHWARVEDVGDLAERSETRRRWGVPIWTAAGQVSGAGELGRCLHGTDVRKNLETRVEHADSPGVFNHSAKAATHGRGRRSAGPGETV